jgi:hypothetical protein
VESRNVTVPVAVAGVTVAVRVKLSPVVGVALDDVSAVVVATRVGDASIVRVSGSDALAASLLEPLYAAVTRCCPTVQKLVIRVAAPALSVAGVPSEVDVVVSVKVTVPVAVEGETVAVKLTFSPVVSVPVGVDVSVVVVVVVPDAVTVIETTLDVLAA